MASGWAFLVARGRRQGYRARLVPSVLRELGLSGLVEDSIGESAPGAGPVVRQVETPHGQVAITCRTHRIRPEDLAEPGSVRDEHGRPLDIVYGFACLGAMTGAPDDADLDTAFQQARETYRRFLADEPGFVTQASPAFALRSSVTPARAPRPATVAHRPGSTRIRVVMVAAAMVVVAMLALAVLLRPAGPPAAELVGTWTGQLEPARSGGPSPRPLTVIIACLDENCATMRGELNDSLCTYSLVQERMDDKVLRAVVKRTSRAQMADCLPNGTVSLRRTGGAAQLDWYTTGSDAPLVRASTLIAFEGTMGVP
jgi:hypothetical protein